MRSSSLLLAAALLAAAPAAAQDAEVSPPGATEYTQRVQAGIQALITGDNGGATNAFREAVELDGARPEAPYYLAVVQRLGQNFEAALTGFRAAADLARSASEPRWEGRALQAVASTLERLDGRLEEARDAWQAYVRFADANSAVAFPGLGRARVQAINIVTEQEVAYVTVRERIAAREQAAAAEAAEAARPRRRRR